MENSLISHNAEQRISSLEIARVVGKPHNDVMKAIRKMEPAWTKVHGGNFSLMQRTIQTNNGGNRVVPCYSLTRLETIFIATKFNDEARAMLVLYCDELERRERERLELDNVYLHEVLNSRGTLTTTEIAKEKGITARRLNQILHERGIIYMLPHAKTWCLYAPYDNKGLMEYETRLYQRRDGRNYTKRVLRWSEKGHQFISNLVADQTNFHPAEAAPCYMELTLQFAM